jgi:adenylate kinase family enzyme
MKVAILGNSGSGKSTLARRLAANGSVPVLDLDLVFWQPGVPVERPSAARIADVQRFCRQHDSWIIEGCYADLIESSLPWNPELIYLDPGRDVCLANCQRRPLEPHKYRTKQDQDEKLAFLLKWVADYYERDGLMSLAAHEALFDRYAGPKKRITEQKAAQPGAKDNHDGA